MTKDQTSEKLVRIRLYKDNNENRDDVCVSVNGKTWTIQRGVPVDVPECVAHVIENAERQNESAMMYMEQLQQANEKANK